MIEPVGVSRLGLRHIGMAIDYRIRYYFDITPYDDLIAYKGAQSLTARREHIDTPAGAGQWIYRITQKYVDTHEAQPIYRRNSDLIVWYDKQTGQRLCTYNLTNGSASGGTLNTDLFEKLIWMSDRLAHGDQPPEGFDKLSDENALPVPLPSGVVKDLFSNLNSLLADCNPVGRRLSKTEEDKINRYCVALAQLEMFSRGHDSRHIRDRIESAESVDSILDYAKQTWIDDMRNLSWHFYDNYNHLLSLQSELNPGFNGSTDVGGADGDLILNRTLLEIKTVKRWDIESERALKQLLGYVLLDYSDHYKFNGIGIYMARQGVLFRWDLAAAIRSLSQGKVNNLNEIRSQFRKIARKVRDTQTRNLDTIAKRDKL